MVVTVLGIIIIFNLEYQNAVVSIVSTPSGISIISKFEQNANKELLILLIFFDNL